MANLTSNLIWLLISLACTMCYSTDAKASSASKTPIDRYALVIGVANYKHLPSLPHALDNAKKVARLLNASDFTVTLLQDPSAVVLKEAFNKLVHQEGKVTARSIVVYYCGQTKSQMLSDGTPLGWILPTDCPVIEDHPRQFSSSAISTQMIANFSNQIRSRYVIMLFDAAFAADLFNLKTPKISSFDPTHLPPVRQFVVAGSAGQSMPKNSMFSDALIDALSGEADIFSDGYVTGTELAVFLDSRIAQATKGHLSLQYGKIDDPNSIRGDFFFHRAEAPLPGTLLVHCRPESARIKILNIKPPFRQGMLLPPGSYQVEVAADGFVTQQKKIIINADHKVRLKVELEKSKSMIVNSLGMTFQWIGHGRYRMGSPVNELGRQSDEPQHWVTFADGFWMQTTEVTVGQYKSFISQTGYVTDAQKNGGCWINRPGRGWQRRPDIFWETAGPWLQTRDERRDHFPATCISWNDAVAFARWLSDREGKLYRLPSEQQWEVACRAGTSAPFSFGQCLNVADANFASQAPVYGTCGPSPSKRPLRIRSARGQGKNRWGLWDMHGNAAEWCADRYGPYGQSDEEATQGLLRNTERIIRGGHFASPAEQCRSASRSSFKPESAANAIGFRLTQLP